MKTTLIKIIAMGLLLVTATTYASPRFEMNETMIRILASYHDLTDHQQDLAADLFKSVKALATEVKKPKADIKEYLAGLVDKDNVEVEQIMLNYKAWQTEVDQKFEDVLRRFAALHHNLSVEQRQNLIDAIKKAQNGHLDD